MVRYTEILFVVILTVVVLASLPQVKVEARTEREAKITYHDIQEWKLRQEEKKQAKIERRYEKRRQRLEIRWGIDIDVSVQ